MVMYNEGRRAAWVEIDLDSIVGNYLQIRKITPGCATIACVKADAYGHGLVKVAWELVKSGTEYLGVATLAEAVALRTAGIRTPIVLLSAVPRGNIKDVLDIGVIPVVTTFDDAQLLSEMVGRAGRKKPAEVFIAIETGMGRLGFLYTVKGIAQILQIQSDLPGVHIKGLFSHFATAEDENPSFALSQIDAFSAFENQLALSGLDPGARTMANSAAIMGFPEAHFEIVRPGLALYGMYPSEEMDKDVLPLKPAMSVKANIVYLRKVPPGFTVSYGRTFVTERDSLIGTLPIGYADGLPRNISGRGRVLIRGESAPIVGNICMDQCMIDVTDIPGITEYDEVVLLGKQGEREIPAEEIAELSGTINYEVTCRFGQRLPKIFKGPQKTA
ncbi:MAG: alanine racemase [Clostridiales Family XIII bacterium]|jgi:alanine racemase|nr:alanine racemase [Clostridiales Family XIII bacterium]